MSAYLSQAASHAKRAEAITLAVLAGDVKMSDPDVAEQLAFHNRAAEVARQAHALAEYRAGRAVWSWPATAPWSGF